MVGVVAYLISPVDLVPDPILILGWTDDLVVITVAMWLLGKAIPADVRMDIEGPNNQVRKQE